jgi:glutathione synthase/RimK-type ligase-like ATP-grasp enzyme
MLGDRVLAAVKRTSKSDFRSNFSLGGNAELTVLEDSERQIVERIAKDLGSDLIGIDFIRHNGGWVLNEIEDVVGTRMLYSLTDLDAAKIYVKHVIARSKESVQLS